MPEFRHLSNIIRLRKELISVPIACEVPGVTVRTFAGPGDAEAWLNLRAAAFAEIVAAGRPWTTADFHREFLAKPWWSPGVMWLATPTANAERQRPESSTSLAGAITLGRAGRPPNEVASVQWLMVDPQFRRRGVAMLLLNTLEAETWHFGERTLTLETRRFLDGGD
ncbi:MAG: GNAT family N-acetyltransferase [Pirellulales bacterium]